MHNKTSIVFLCIILAMAIVLGYILISGLNNNINRFKEQINNTSAYFSHESSGLESNTGSVEPDN